MPETSAPGPWTPQADPTTELPPTVLDQLPGAIVRPPVTDLPYLDQSGDRSGPPSRWPGPAAWVGRHAWAGVCSTARRVRPPVVRYATVHPEAWKVRDLEAELAALQSRGREAWSEHRAVRSRLREEKIRQWWGLLSRKLLVAGGAVGLVALAFLVLWLLVSAHGIKAPFVGSAVLIAWYTGKGWVLVRWAARAGEDTETGPVWETRPPPPGGPQDQSGTGPQDHGCRPRWLRLVHPDRTGPDPDRTTEVRRTAPARPDPGPCPLTQDRVERALKAHNLIGKDDQIELLDTCVEGNGWSVIIKLPETQVATKVLTKRHELAGALDSDDPLIALMPVKGSARSFKLTEYLSDPMDVAANPSAISPLVHVDQTRVFAGVPFGRLMDGTRVTMRITHGGHTLIGGGSGSGKSNAMRLRALTGALSPHATQLIIDPKGAPAWKLFSPVARVISGQTPDDQREAANAMLWLAETELPRRIAVLAEYAALYPGLVDDDAITEDMTCDPTLGVPFHQTIIDEFHSALAFSAPIDPNDPKSEKCGAIIRRCTQTVISQGRSLAMVLDAMTQRASGTLVDTDIRAIFNGLACGSVNTDDDAKMVLGPRFREAGMDPVALESYTHAGWFYVKGGIVSPEGMKWALVQCDEASVTATKIAITRAVAICREVRPELLPSAPKRPRSTPDNAPSTAPASELARPLDLDPLRRIVEILAPEGTMLATALTAELGHRWPAQHGNVVTVAQLNALLATFNLDGEDDLRTSQYPKLPDGSKPHRLSHGPCAHRLHALEVLAEHQSEHPPERGDGD